ncbi:hypothetical protein ACFE04_022325 [Oxalis oulophora]
MKILINRFSRISDSSNYAPLRRSNSISTARRPSLRRARPIRNAIKKAAAARRARAAEAAADNNNNNSRPPSSGPVPQGHVPVYVGDEMERFVVNADLLNHPVFIELLEKSAQEYGYEHKGGLRVPCQVLEFERIMEDLRLGLVVNVDDHSRVFNTCLKEEEEDVN